MHNIDEKGRIIRLLQEENRKLKQKVFELEEELKKYEFDEYIAENLDFIQVFHDPTNKRVKLEKNATYGYED